MNILMYSFSKHLGIPALQRKYACAYPYFRVKETDFSEKSSKVLKWFNMPRLKVEPGFLTPGARLSSQKPASLCKETWILFLIEFN